MTSVNGNQLKVGLLLESKRVNTIEYKALKRLLNEQEVKITLVAINKKKTKKENNNNYSSRIEEIYSSIINNDPFVLVKADELLARKLGNKSAQELHSKWSGTKNINQILTDHNTCIQYYSPTPVEGDNRYTIPKQIVDSFSENTDIIINFEHSILSGKILTVTEFGVISLHSGDVRKYRGRPPGIWQYINDEKQIGVTLQQLTPVLDGGKPIVIRNTNISKQDTLTEIMLKQKRLVPPMLSMGVKKLKNGFVPKEPNSKGVLTHSSDKQKWSVVLEVLKKNWVRRISRKSI